MRSFKFFFVWSSILSGGIFFFAGRKCADLVVIFNNGRNLWYLVVQNWKSCFCIKYLTLVWLQKLIPVMHRTLVLVNNYLFHNFLNISNFAFVSSQKNIFHFKKCLCYVYVYATALTWTVHLMCSCIYGSFS